jgi:hypothetical protein
MATSRGMTMPLVEVLIRSCFTHQGTRLDTKRLPMKLKLTASEFQERPLALLE